MGVFSNDYATARPFRDTRQQEKSSMGYPATGKML
jgi:hypothetical protein